MLSASPRFRPLPATALKVANSILKHICLGVGVVPTKVSTGSSYRALLVVNRGPNAQQMSPHSRAGTDVGFCQFHLKSTILTNSNPQESALAEPWKVVQATGQRIDIERGLERKEVWRPSNPAARAMFMQIRPGELIDDDTIYFFRVVSK